MRSWNPCMPINSLSTTPESLKLSVWSKSLTSRYSLVSYILFGCAGSVQVALYLAKAVMSACAAYSQVPADDRGADTRYPLWSVRAGAQISQRSGSGSEISDFAY